MFEAMGQAGIAEHRRPAAARRAAEARRFERAEVMDSARRSRRR
jgi:hypothetical protein